MNSVWYVTIFSLNIEYYQIVADDTPRAWNDNRVDRHTIHSPYGDDFIELYHLSVL